MNAVLSAWAWVHANYDPLWKYLATFVVPPQYVWNVLRAASNLIAATTGAYRPNGDGWVHSWWYCVDCLGNALAGGDWRETISSRAGKARKEGRTWGCVLCAVLGWAATIILRKPTDHCADSVQPDVGSQAVLPD